MTESHADLHVVTRDPEPAPRRRWQDIAAEGLLVLPNTAKLLVRLARDPRVPVRHKMAAAAAAAFIASPIDLIPDLLLGLGVLDDLVLAALAVAYLIEGAGRAVVEEHWDGSVDGLDLVLAVVEWGVEIIPVPLRRSLAGRRVAAS